MNNFVYSTKTPVSTRLRNNYWGQTVLLKRSGGLVILWYWCLNYTVLQSSTHSVLTPCLRASGAVHLIGSFPQSRLKFSSLASPKSATFATPASDISTLRAARSLWTTFRSSRYSIPLHVSLWLTNTDNNISFRMSSFTGQQANHTTKTWILVQTQYFELLF